MSTAPIACQARNLSVAYRADPVLRQVDFSVPVGSVMGVVGPNGSGKSTLIKAMLGLVKPLTGTAEFFGRPLDDVRLRVGYMAQGASVDWDFPTTVIDLVTMGTYGELGWIRRPGKAERTRAMAAMEQTGIPELASQQIGELSGAPSSPEPWYRRRTCTSWMSRSRASTRRVRRRCSTYSTT